MPAARTLMRSVKEVETSDTKSHSAIRKKNKTRLNRDIEKKKEDVKILSKSPTFAPRNILSKETSMDDVEKGLIKDKYGWIG